MNICSALLCPVNFIAQGVRRLVTTSGSVTTRYQRLDSLSGERASRFSVFGLKFGGRKNSGAGSTPFTKAPDQAYLRACGQTPPFHIKKTDFLGLSFREIKYAIPNTYSKNMTPLSSMVYEQFGQSLVGGPTAPVVAAQETQAGMQEVELQRAPEQKIEEQVHAKALPESQETELEAERFSNPMIFLDLFGDALERLAKDESADLDAHLNKQGSSLENEKKFLFHRYKHQIIRSFKDDVASISSGVLTVSRQYNRYIRAENKILKNPGDQDDYGRFRKFMSQFELEIVNASEFRFSRRNGRPLVFDVPPVLLFKESAAPNDAAGAFR